MPFALIWLGMHETVEPNVRNRGQWKDRRRRTPLDLEVTISAKGAASGQAVNVSASGVLVRSGKDLSLDQLVLVEFVLEGKHLALMGKVARIDGDQAGLEFVALSRDERLALVTYVANRLAENEATRLLASVTESEDRVIERPAGELAEASPGASAEASPDPSSVDTIVLAPSHAG